MNRILLLRTLSAAALAAVLSPAFAATKPAIPGGGGTSAQPDYAGPNDINNNPVSEFSVYNAAKTSKATFSTYWGSGSGVGQQAFIADDLTCDINKVTGGNSGKCAGPAGAAGNTVDYAVSDSILSGAQISSWATASFGQSAAGNLIQIPSMGTGTSVPVANSAITSNGQLTLSDNDLCGVFSGKITDWSQITDSATTPTPGAITVLYRNDSSGATLIFTTHLAAVCNSGNSNITFSAVTTFQSLFANNTPPTNFIGFKGAQAQVDDFAGCNGPLPSAITYVTPDYTSLYPNSNSYISCQINGSNRSPLLVAGLINAANNTAYLPTVANIYLGLQNGKKGVAYNLTPPTNPTDGANPALWVPVTPVVTKGYPIVGYTTFDLAQCYANTVAGKAIENFLALHFNKTPYTTIEAANGYAALNQGVGGKFLVAIQNDLLANKNGWNTDIDNATACAGKAGR